MSEGSTESKCHTSIASHINYITNRHYFNHVYRTETPLQRHNALTSSRINMKLTLIALGGTLTAALANRINTNTEVFNATSVGLEPRDSEWMHFCPNDWEMRCCIGGTVFDENCRAEDTRT